jgi:hypothetical protein
MRITATNITITMGSAMTNHSKNVIGSPVSDSSSSRPIRFGGLPDRQQQAAHRDHAAHHSHHAERDRKHHGRAGGVRHHRRGERSDQPEGQDDAVGRAAHRAHAQHAEGEAAVQAVHDHRLGDDEAADEQEDGVVGEEAEHHVHGAVALGRRRRGLEERAQHHAQHRRHRDRDRLGEPPDDHEGEDGREPVLVPVEVERDDQHYREHDRPEEQPDGSAASLEALLRLRQSSFLLVERAVGAALQSFGAVTLAVAREATLAALLALPGLHLHWGPPPPGWSPYPATPCATPPGRR